LFPENTFPALEELAFIFLMNRNHFYCLVLSQKGLEKRKVITSESRFLLFTNPGWLFLSADELVKK
jgi:hypothetical protein